MICISESVLKLQIKRKETENYSREEATEPIYETSCIKPTKPRITALTIPFFMGLPTQEKNRKSRTCQFELAI
jgi:hypothetical protein